MAEKKQKKLEHGDNEKVKIRIAKGSENLNIKAVATVKIKPGTETKAKTKEKEEENKEQQKEEEKEEEQGEEQEEEKEDGEEKGGSKVTAAIEAVSAVASGNLTSPEGILMLCIAVFLDIISFIPAINVISDIFGILIIGGWLVITRPEKALKKAVKKFLIACGIELIPIVSIAPSWTWFVYKTLKDG